MSSCDIEYSCIQIYKHKDNLITWDKYIPYAITNETVIKYKIHSNDIISESYPCRSMSSPLPGSCLKMYGEPFMILSYILLASLCLRYTYYVICFSSLILYQINTVIRIIKYTLN